MVTHDVEFAARYATGCALMFDGLLLSEGEPHALDVYKRQWLHTFPALRGTRIRLCVCA